MTFQWESVEFGSMDIGTGRSNYTIFPLFFFANKIAHVEIIIINIS